MWVSGWSVAKKRPECPFVCHALIINQNTIMFGILNDLIHPNDMFTVYWELLRQQLSQASLHDTTSAAGVVCWAEMHHTKWPTCTTARSVGRASCKWWTRNKSFTRTSNLRSANSEGFHERKKKHKHARSVRWREFLMSFSSCFTSLSAGKVSVSNTDGVACNIKQPERRRAKAECWSALIKN